MSIPLITFIPARTQDQTTFDTNTEGFISELANDVIPAMNTAITAMNLNSTTDTSASSNSIATGAKTFTVSASKSFVAGMWLVIADTAAPTTNAMFAQVTSYSGTTLIVNSYAIMGSGTKTAWTISQSAPAALEGLYSLVAGSATQVHSVGPATAAAHATRLDQSKIAQDFRLSLTTALPVTTADITAATTIYCVPYTGNLIGLWNGTVWVNYPSAEMSIALGTLVSGKAYDVFCYQNAGVPTLELGTAWTNDTTRAVALAYQDGICVKSGDPTRRYRGTFYATSTTTTEDSAANRYLWNYDNRKLRAMRRFESTASWTYTTATNRQANNSTSNQLNFIIGVSEDEVSARLQAHAASSVGGVAVSISIGLDSTTTASANCVYQLIQTPATAAYSGEFYAETSETPSAGRHYLTWLEYSVASGTTTWYGSSTNGLIGSIMA